MTMVLWSDPRGLVRHASLGVEFIVTFLIPLALGYWLDRREGTLPGFLLLGGSIGFALGLWRVVQQGRRIQRENQPPPDEGGPPAA
jgi:F0F1-type ATP synthase assembly protein I